MSELVKRLRGAGKHPSMGNTCPVNVFLVHDAADRIEALEVEAREWREACIGHGNRADALRARIEALEAAHQMRSARGIADKRRDALREMGPDKEKPHTTEREGQGDGVSWANPLQTAPEVREETPNEGISPGQLPKDPRR